MKAKVLARLDINADPPIIFNDDYCDLCGACISICPANCINMNHQKIKIIGMECTKCGLCIPACPVAAICWNELEEVVENL